ncbi:hypothetical protein BDV93DRAFT_504331 [Ceratobasidium sp. AG-I]|nr:hypothetical protein BDV93DRAFT_504331 [Ceratobasidium sp. AG-I]
MPSIILLQIASLLRFGPLVTRNSGSRFRPVAAWLAFLYMGFSVISFRPQTAYFKLQHWISSDTFSSYGTWALSPRSRPHALGIMETSLAFSKLSPHLGNLAPDALQPILNSGVRSTAGDLPITTCIWIPSTHLDVLDRWADLSGCYISVLITSSHAPSSPDHQRLVKEIQKLIKRKTRLRGSVVLLSTRIDPPNPNTYINLARLFSKSPWSLLISPALALPPADGFSRNISELELRTQVMSPDFAFKTPGTKADPGSDSVLVPQDSPTWCSEQYSVLTPGQEWTKCIQELLYYYRESGAVGRAA